MQQRGLTELYLTEKGGALLPEGFTQIEAVPGPAEEKSPSQGMCLTVATMSVKCCLKVLRVQFQVLSPTRLARELSPKERREHRSLSQMLISGPLGYLSLAGSPIHPSR